MEPFLPSKVHSKLHFLQFLSPLLPSPRGIVEKIARE